MIGDIVCDTSSAYAFSGVQVHTMYSALTMGCPVVNKAWQYATTCAGQILLKGIGYQPSTRQGGLAPDQMVAQVGTHVWASVVGALGVGGKLKFLNGKFRSTPVDVGTFPVVDASSTVKFDVPAVEPGQHHLELTGDDGRMYRIPIYVTAEPVSSDALMFVVEGASPEVTPGEGPVDPTDPTQPGEPGTGGSLGNSGGLFGSS